MDENKSEIYALIEASLFICPRPLTLADLYSVVKIPKKKIEAILEQMIKNNNYKGIEIAKENNAYYFKVCDKYLNYVSKFNPNKDFSRAQTETLAYIAYKNPVMQSDIIKVRGNRAYDHIKDLLKNRFIDIEPAGHTNKISVTNKFLNYFGVNSKEELKEYFEGKKEVGEEKE